MLNVKNGGSKNFEWILSRALRPSSWNTLPKLAAVITVVLGLIVLTGWVFSIPLLKSVLPGAVEMKANTAIGLVLSACALFILSDWPSRLQQRMAQAIGLLVLTLGLATLGQYLFGWQLGIDELLFRDTANAYNVIRGRMSPFSAAVFSMIGLALTSLPWRSLRPLVWLASVAVMIIGAVSFLGYLWNASELVTDSWLPPIAVNTAVIFVLLGAGIFRINLTSVQPRGAATGIEIKILAGFILAFLLLVMVGGYTYRRGAEFEDSVKLVEHTQEVRAALGQLYGDISDIQSSQRSYLLTGKKNYWDEFRRLAAAVNDDRQNLAKLVVDNPAQEKNLAQLVQLIRQRTDILRNHLAIFEQHGFVAARKAIATDGGLQIMQDIRTLTEHMDSIESGLLSTREASLAHARKLTLLALLVTAIVTAGILSALFLTIRREIITRAQAEQQLRTSEENLSVTLNSIGDGVMATDAEGRVTRLNTVAEQLTGWTRSEAAGRPVVEVFRIINLHTRQPAIIPVAHTLSQGTVHGLANDTVLIARDGSECPIADSCAPIRGPDGKAIGAVLVFRDMSREYAAQAALRDSAVRIQTMFNTVGDGIITINEQGIVETMNPAAERIFGYEDTEVIGQSINMLMPEPHRTLHDQYLRRYCETGEAHIIGREREVEGRRKDGGTFPIDLLVSEMNLGSQRHFTAIMRDITARKEAESQLDLFFSLSLDMLCISSADGYFKRVSPAFTRTLGWSIEEILKRPFLDFVHPDDHAATLREVQRQVAAGEKVLHFENRYLHKDGSWRVLSWMSVPYGDGLMFATARDVTDSKQIQQELVAAKEKAELANRAKDSFLATMSHEIRTPLTGMLGMLELLSLTTLDKEQHATLDVAWESGRGLLRIVSDILDWSKIEEGKLAISPLSTSIPQLLQEVVNTYSRVASAKSLVLRYHADTRLSPAHIVDPLRLSQVLNNFVSNAIKFTHQGEIELRAELIEQIESAERIRFSVRDTGIGIAREAQQRLFQRYRQESVDTTRLYGGTGLGLAICRRLAELMDGQVELESEPGRGSTFSIILTLPVSGEEGAALQIQNLEVAQKEVMPLSDGGENAPLILAVDDHPTNRNLLARQLKLLGLCTETAEDGKAALSMWREGRFALVITDCHMPEMDGYALSRAIRKIESDERLPHTPIIAWTANALANETTRCTAAGMDELLVKPANLRQLRAVLAKCLTVTETAAMGTGVAETVSARAGAAPYEAVGKRFAGPVDYAALGSIVPDAAEQVRVLHDFYAHILADHARLQEMLKQNDPVNVERTAHRMKGSSRMVGAVQMENGCAAIEQAAHDGDMMGARTSGTALHEAITQFGTYLVEIDKSGSKNDASQ